MVRPKPDQPDRLLCLCSMIAHNNFRNYHVCNKCCMTKQKNYAQRYFNANMITMETGHTTLTIVQCHCFTCALSAKIICFKLNIFVYLLFYKLKFYPTSLFNNYEINLIYGIAKLNVHTYVFIWGSRKHRPDPLQCRVLSLAVASYVQVSALQVLSYIASLCGESIWLREASKGLTVAFQWTKTILSDIICSVTT